MRAYIVGILCLALLLVRVSGVHEHLAFDHRHGMAVEIHHTAESVIADEHDANHSIAHFQHGDVDADSASKAFGKLTPLKFFPVLATLIVLLVLCANATRVVRCWPPSHVPKWRSRFYLLPPSHAPPATA
jgi:hypothetical protein